MKATSAAFDCRLTTDSSRLRACPNSAQVIASSREDLPAPLEPEMQARSKPLKSSSTGLAVGQETGEFQMKWDHRDILSLLTEGNPPGDMLAAC